MRSIPIGYSYPYHLVDLHQFESATLAGASTSMQSIETETPSATPTLAVGMSEEIDTSPVSLDSPSSNETFNPPPDSPAATQELMTPTESTPTSTETAIISESPLATVELPPPDSTETPVDTRVSAEASPPVIDQITSTDMPVSTKVMAPAETPPAPETPLPSATTVLTVTPTIVVTPITTVSTEIPAVNASTLATDKFDYIQGEGVQIIGSGFIPITAFDATVIRPDGGMAKGDGSSAPGWDAITTDANGTFRYHDKMEEPLGLYTVKINQSS